jgi:hypothetical protein
MKNRKTHDLWFRSQVRQAIDAIENDAVRVLSQKEHEARWRKKRAALLARAQRKGA